MYYNVIVNDMDYIKFNGIFEWEIMFILFLGEVIIYNFLFRLNSIDSIIIEEDLGKVFVMYRVMWVGIGGKYFFSVW